MRNSSPSEGESIESTVPLKVDICAYDSLDCVGGPVVWIQRMSPALRAAGFDLRVLLFTWEPTKTGRVAQALIEQEIPFEWAPFSDTETNVQWLLRMAESRKPDVFVANHVIPAYYAARYLRQAGVPTVGVLRSDDKFYRAIANRFVIPSSPWQVACIVCVSEFLRASLIKRAKSILRVSRIPSGAPVPESACAPPLETMKVAYVGRMVEEQKQASLLVRSLLRVADEVPGIEACLYGEGSASEDVQRIIANSGSSRVKFAGQLSSEELQAQLLESHVIVLLSDYEGTPMAVMEGMACGCVPVCLATRSGIPELVEHEVTGLLVEDRGDSFVAAVKRLREDSELWARLSHGARARIEARYSIKESITDWTKLILELRSTQSEPGSFEAPRDFHLPRPHPDFLHQDWRKPSALDRILKRVRYTYRRTRMLAGRIRRQLLRQPIP